MFDPVIVKRGNTWVVQDKAKTGKPARDISPAFRSEAEALKYAAKAEGKTVRASFKTSGRIVKKPKGKK